MTKEELEGKEERRAKYRRKHPKVRNPFARALYEDNQFRQKIKGVGKKDRLRPQDLKRIIEKGDEDVD